MTLISEKKTKLSGVGEGDLRKQCSIVTTGSLVGSQVGMNGSMVMILAYLEGTYPGWLK